MDTNELILTDILNCGYADLSMLDILYAPIGDDIDSNYLDRIELVRTCDLNDILYQFYETCNNAIRNKAEELLQEYKESLDEEGNPTNATTVVNLVSDVDMEEIFYPEEYDKLQPLTEEQIETIETNLTKMEEQYPFTNYLDSSFGTDLDQTLDEDKDVYSNAIDLIKYWIS